MPEGYKVAYDSYAIDAKYTIDPETGFLYLPIKAAKVGIMYYPDANERRYFPAEVLKAAADSLNYAIITKFHPSPPGALIDKNNIQQLSKGFIKSDSEFDGTYVKGNAVIQIDDLINGILDKSFTEGSAGYTYGDDKKPGKNEYGEFDTIITWIKYNHFAALPKGFGRAGGDVKFGTDQKGNIMGTIKKELSSFKVGTDSFLDKVTITYTEDNQSAMDSMSIREDKLKDVVRSQTNTIQTLESSLAANKESLKTARTAQDGLINPGDLNSLTAELLDVRQAAVKIGLDCKEETDAHLVKQKILEKMLPTAFKDLKDKDRLKSKTAVDAAYVAFKENMGFHQQVYNTEQALGGNKGRIVTPPTQSKAPLYQTLEGFRR